MKQCGLSSTFSNRLLQLQCVKKYCCRYFVSAATGPLGLHHSQQTQAWITADWFAWLHSLKMCLSTVSQLHNCIVVIIIVLFCILVVNSRCILFLCVLLNLLLWHLNLPLRGSIKCYQSIPVFPLTMCLCVCKRLPVEKCISKRIQLPERLLGVNDQSIARDDSFCVAIHHSNEGICGGLRANPHSRKILLQQVTRSKTVRRSIKINKTRDEIFYQPYMGKSFYLRQWTSICLCKCN